MGAEVESKAVDHLTAANTHMGLAFQGIVVATWELEDHGAPTAAAARGKMREALEHIAGFATIAAASSRGR